MKQKSEESGMEKFRKFPFSVLVKQDEELINIRSEYLLKSKSERRRAAEMKFQSAIANGLLSKAITTSLANETSENSYSDWPPGVIELAIDPLYALAILTVGSFEYNFKRIEEAMNLFVMLTQFPENEENLSTIIDQAGNHLIDNEDFKNAIALYTVVEKTYPKQALYSIGVGYCLAKQGRHEEAIEKHKRAVSLEPNNYEYLSDLGFCLLEAENFDESEQILKKSISLSPKGYEVARHNLKELRKRKKEKSKPIL